MEQKEKNPAAVALGRSGAAKRWANATDEEKSEAARKRVQGRWGKKKAGKK